MLAWTAISCITSTDETKFGFVDLLSIHQRQVNCLFENISFICVVIVLSLSRPYKLHEDINNGWIGSPFHSHCLVLRDL